MSFWFQEEGSWSLDVGWVAKTEASKGVKWWEGCVEELGKGRSRKPWWKFTAIMSFVEPHGTNYDLKKTQRAWREMCLALDIFGQGLFLSLPLAMLEHATRGNNITVLFRFWAANTDRILEGGFDGWVHRTTTHHHHHQLSGQLKKWLFQGAIL